jgi:8-oxo-dGTP pyrophosphatase MutT (NUDIX family)
MSGAGAVLIMDYHKYNKTDLIIILGKERFGRYKNSYSLPGGGYERKDGTFSGRPDTFNTMRREVKEEIGIPKVLKTLGHHRPPDIHVGKTPIWLVKISSGVSRKHFVPNNEISKIEFFKVKSMIMTAIQIKNQYGNFPHQLMINVETIDGVKKPVSSYALAALYKLYMKGR